MADDEVLAEYTHWLYATAGRLLGSFADPDLDDLVQEGYIAMWRALRSYDESQGALPAWLTAKAEWRMRTVASRRQPRAEDELDESLAGASLLESVDIAYHHGEIADAISGLAPAQRRYVIARFWYGLSGQEMRDLGVFRYDPSSLWTRPRNGARWKLARQLSHMEGAHR